MAVAVSRPAVALAPARRFRVLALGPQEAWPATDGGKEGIHGALQALAGRADVMYACPGEPADEETAAHYRAIGVDYRPVAFQPRETPAIVLAATLQLKPFKFYKYGTPEAERCFDAAIGGIRPDAVLCFHAHMEELGQRLKRRRGWPAPVLVREHNIEYEMVASYRAAMPLVQRALTAPIEWLTRRAEHGIWRRADATVFLSDRDFATAQASGVRGNLMLAPEGVPIPPLRSATRPRGVPQLLIPLNRRAPQSVANLRAFLHDHWAVVAGSEAIADVTLAITGVDAVQLAELTRMSVAEQQRLRVHALGFLKELAPAFERALALVAPTFIGAGIRKKILESMAHQLPVIATDFDIDTCGYFAPGENILRLGTPAEFMATVANLVQDEVLWQKLSVNGRATVERHANWDFFAQALVAEMACTVAPMGNPVGKGLAARSNEPAAL